MNEYSTFVVPSVKQGNEAVGGASFTYYVERERGERSEKARGSFFSW